MLVFDSVKFALKTIWHNKARSFLTMLGVIIGVSSVITLMAIGEGVKKDVKSTVNSLGTNVAFIIAGNIDPNNMAGGAPSNPANFIKGDILKRADVESLKKLPAVDHAAAMTLVSGILKKDGQKSTAMLVGVDNDIQYAFQALKIKKGRFFEEPAESHKKVIILGSLVSEQLFKDEEPVAKQVQINNESFEVIGVFAKPADASSFLSNDMELISTIPFGTATDLAKGEETIHRIGVKIKDDQDTKIAVAAIKEDMKSRHSEEDYSVFTQDDILNMLSAILNLMTAMVSGIAAISLIVGGVGIMNIMLVTVTERTKEIGIRKAVGATNAIILAQFLIEAVVISLVGGLLGLASSKTATYIISQKTSLHPFISWQAIVLACSVSVIVGIVFGLFPAIRASQKNPIEALRYE